MAQMLLPMRFVLDEDQVVAALSLAGVRPNKRSMLPDSPPLKQPLPLLQGTGMLTEDGKGLIPEAVSIMRIAAEPDRMLSVIANNADRDEWVETSFVHGEKDSSFVSMATDNGKYDMALLTSSVEAAVLIDDMLGLTMLISRPGESHIKLGLFGYTAVLAMADVLQTTRLQARLERSRRPIPVLSAQLLDEQLLKGLDNTDTRWAVTAGRMVCPSHLRLAVGSMVEGLTQLHEVGLVEGSSSQGFNLTQSGFLLSSSLGQLVNTAGFSLIVGHNDDRLTIAHASLFRTTFGIWLVSWSSVSAQDAEVELFEASASGAIGLIRGLLEPVDLPEIPDVEPAREEIVVGGPRIPVDSQPVETVSLPSTAQPAPPDKIACKFCGTNNDVDALFCKGCGQPVPKKEPEQEAAPVVSDAPEQGVTAPEKTQEAKPVEKPKKELPPQAPRRPGLVVTSSKGTQESPPAEDVTSPQTTGTDNEVKSQLEATQREIDNRKLNISKLEVRYKVGELSEKQYNEEVNKLQAKIDELVKILEELKGKM